MEAALTLPMVVFLILGTLQLFLMLQARIVAEHAAFMAARVGSVNHGNCDRMTHAAVLTLLPTFSSFLGNAVGSPAEKLANAFDARLDEMGGAPDQLKFVPALDAGHDREIVWIDRVSPLQGELNDSAEEEFDNPDSPNRYTLGVRLVYWYPLKIPFANWVMSRMFLASLGIREFTGTNPIMPTQTNAHWESHGGNTLETELANEMRDRIDARQYAFPIQASFAMRMMTPPRRSEFPTQNCPHP